MDDDEYIRLIHEVGDALSVARPRMKPDTAEFTESTLWNEPGLAISHLLLCDADGEAPLPDETVARLWDIGYRLGYDAEFLLPSYGHGPLRGGREEIPRNPYLPLLPGGGHGPGRGRPGKSEFPARWGDDDVLRHLSDVARHPSAAVALPTGDFRATGERDGVVLSVVVSRGGEVLTGYPAAGEGVVTNPLDEQQVDPVRRLQALLDALVPPDDTEPRTSLTELMSAGEWPYVVRSLQVLATDLSGERQRELDALARLADVPPRSSTP